MEMEAGNPMNATSQASLPAVVAECLREGAARQAAALVRSSAERRRAVIRDLGTLTRTLEVAMPVDIRRRLCFSCCAGLYVEHEFNQAEMDELASVLKLPAASTGTCAIAERAGGGAPCAYEKENILVRDDMPFRYGHYDYSFLSTYASLLGQRVLHLGCNTGANSIILARLGHEVHAVDLNEAALERARENLRSEPESVRRRVRFQLAHFPRMELPEAYYSSAIALDVIEHLYPEDLEATLRRVKAALQPGGTLLIHTPNGDSFADPVHIQKFTVETARELIGRHFAARRCYVVREPTALAHTRINVVATTFPPPAANQPQRLQPTSAFFNEHYTAERAKAAIETIHDAVQTRRPCSFIRLGDAEVELLMHGHKANPMPGAEIERHLGVNPERLPPGELKALQDELIATCLSSDVLATHRQTINTEWAAKCAEMFRAYGVDSAYLPNEVDVVFNAEIFDQGLLLPLLARGRVLLVGNSAPTLHRKLLDGSLHGEFDAVGLPADPPVLAGAVAMPHSGDDAYRTREELWEEICGYDFDLALVSGSVIGKTLAGRIKRQLGAVALDIGWNMQYMTGVSSPVAPAREYCYMTRRRGYKTLFPGRNTPL